VVAEAETFVDEVGASGLTISALAQRLGVAQPSLYKHLDGMDDLHRSISILAMRELGATLARAAAGRARDDAVSSMSIAYRDWATQHPGRYASIQHAPAAEDAEAQEAAAAIVGVCLDVLAGYDLQGDDAIDALRALRAGLHGFIVLEQQGGFGIPLDVERSFRRMVQAFARSFTNWATDERA
jgi:AcrR family transcriptional regulator